MSRTARFHVTTQRRRGTKVIHGGDFNVNAHLYGNNCGVRVRGYIDEYGVDIFEVFYTDGGGKLNKQCFIAKVYKGCIDFKDDI